MDAFMGLIVLGTSVWMAVDASSLGYDKRDIKGIAAMGPAGWLFAGLLLWIVAFPLYLVKRGELKAAGERRRQLALTGHAPGYGYGAMPASMHGHGYGPMGPAAHGHGGGQMPVQPYAQHHGPVGHYGPMPPRGPMVPHGPMPPQPHGPVAGHQPHTPMAPPTHAPAPQFDLADEITKLARLRDAGILTDAEFQQQKTQLLARM